jgi:hypothetical protein
MNWDRGEVTIKYLHEDTDEVREATVPALIANGLFAVHKPVEGLYENSLFTCCLSHVLSGWRIARFFNSYRARAFAEVLVELTGLAVWRFVHQEDKPTLEGDAATLIAIERAVWESVWEDVAEIAYDDLPQNAKCDGTDDEAIINHIADQLKTAKI